VPPAIYLASSANATALHRYNRSQIILIHASEANASLGNEA